MAGDREKTGDWTGDRWAPEDTTDEATVARDTDLNVDDERWNKTQFVGDQGDGAPAPVDPDTMPEGENALSGDRHASGEQHFADTDGTHRAAVTGDRPLDQ